MNVPDIEPLPRDQLERLIGTLSFHVDDNYLMRYRTDRELMLVLGEILQPLFGWRILFGWRTIGPRHSGTASEESTSREITSQESFPRRATLEELTSRKVTGPPIEPLIAVTPIESSAELLVLTTRDIPIHHSDLPELDLPELDLPELDLTESDLTEYDQLIPTMGIGPSYLASPPKYSFNWKGTVSEMELTPEGILREMSTEYLGIWLQLTPERILREMSTEHLKIWLQLHHCGEMNRSARDQHQKYLQKALLLLRLNLADKSRYEIFSYLQSQGFRMHRTRDLTGIGLTVKLNHYLRRVSAMDQSIPLEIWNSCSSVTCLLTIGDDILRLIFNHLDVEDERALVQTCQSYYRRWNDPEQWKEYQMPRYYPMLEGCVIQGLEIPLNLLLNQPGRNNPGSRLIELAINCPYPNRSRIIDRILQEFERDSIPIPEIDLPGLLSKTSDSEDHLVRRLLNLHPNTYEQVEGIAHCLALIGDPKRLLDWMQFMTDWGHHNHSAKEQYLHKLLRTLLYVDNYQLFCTFIRYLEPCPCGSRITVSQVDIVRNDRPPYRYLSLLLELQKDHIVETSRWLILNAMASRDENAIASTYHELACFCNSHISSLEDQEII